MIQNMKNLERYGWRKEGYDPFLISDGWQIANLTACSEHRFDDLIDTEVHKATDEVFVCLEGMGILITADYSGEKAVFAAELMENGVTYNVPAGLWHNISMSDDAKIIIVEKSDTHINDVEHRLLTPEEKEEVDRLIYENTDALRISRKRENDSD